MIRLLLFDWADVCGLYDLRVFNTFLESQGYSVDIARAHFGELKPAFDRDQISEEEFWSKMAEKLKFKGHWSELANANQKNLKPNQPLLEYIQTIKNKVHIALLSNLDKTSIQAIQNKLNLKDYFEKVYFSYEYKTGKLDKPLIDKLLVDFNVKPEEILFIDDFQGNLEKAEKYGMKTLLYTDVETVKKELNKILGGIG